MTVPKTDSEALIRKLEEKAPQLEEANRAFEQDIAGRKWAEAPL
jgi:exonuclease VII small subunit